LAAGTAVESILSALVADLRAAAGDNLVGVALYGGVVKGRFTPGISDINILVVLRDAGLANLEPLAPTLTGARRAHRVSAFIATADDLRDAAHLFPVKIRDIQTAHRVLFGTVPLGDIAVDPGTLRLRMLQELKNTQFRLRQRTAERGADPAVLWGGLVQSLPKLAVVLESALRARGESVPSDRPAVLRAAARSLGLREDAMAPFAQIRRHDRRPDDGAVRVLAAAYLDLLASLSRALATALPR